MSTTGRIHVIGSFVARLELLVEGVVLLAFAGCAYREGSIWLGILCISLLLKTLFEHMYPRPPDNRGMVMWGVYLESRPLMEAAFYNRREAEQYALARSLGDEERRYGVYARYLL